MGTGKALLGSAAFQSLLRVPRYSLGDLARAQAMLNNARIALKTNRLFDQTRRPASAGWQFSIR
jgi:hypothetical protein